MEADGLVADTVSGNALSSTAESPNEIVEQTLPAPPAQPAVLIDFGHESVSSPEARERLDEVAQQFTDTLTGSGLDPASEEYRNLWDEQQSAADTRFRSMYGGQAWASHHIRSYHAAHPEPAPQAPLR